MNTVLIELPQDGPKNQKIKKNQIKLQKEVQEKIIFIRTLFKET